MEGVVNAAHEAVLALSIEGPAGETRDVAAVVDTGSCQPLHAGRGQGVIAMTGLLIHASFGGLAARGGPLRNRSGQTL